MNYPGFIRPALLIVGIVAVLLLWLKYFGSAPANLNAHDAFDELDRKLLQITLKATKKNKYPKILHQTWKTTTLPVHYAKLRQTWLDLHPNWTHHVWTDAENRMLVEKHYPWFLAAYDVYPIGVMKSDVMRYIYMHRYGGMYADLDVEPLRKLDFMLKKEFQPVVLGYMACENSPHDDVPPSWFMAKSGHPFWLMALIRAQDALIKYPEGTRPEYVTGPVLVYENIETYINFRSATTGRSMVTGSLSACSPNIGDIRIMEPGLMFPFHWKMLLQSTKMSKYCNGKAETFNPKKCKKFFPNAYTIQYNGYSWKEEWDQYLKQKDATQ